MSQKFIEIRGARENNLKDISLRIPKGKITIFTGVSGSGKSSIVFDTIAAEAQRLLNENFSMFVRNFLPSVSQPDVEAIKNLNMAVIVDQKRLGGGSHSTVGTVTDIAPLLRLLYSRVGKPHVGNANLFSFNDSQGMCPECNGMGRKIGVNLDQALDNTKSLNDGAIRFPGYGNDSWDLKICTHSDLFDNNKKLADYSDEEMELLLHATPRKIELGTEDNSMKMNFEGIVRKFSRKYIQRDLKTLSERTQKSVKPFLILGQCPHCKGARLNQDSLNSRIHGYNIAELSAMQIDELVDVVSSMNNPVAVPIVHTILEHLQHLIDIGLDYLSLDRPTDTLSGGESQRVKIVKHLNGSLVDVMYIFDEPSIGLHPRDTHRLNELLKKLRDRGNTVLVVEHDPDVIKIADYIVDVGPKAGSAGGHIVFEGTYSDLLNADTLTGQYLKHSISLKKSFRKPTGAFPIKHATANNLKDISVDIPKGILTVVTGVAGSGKSSLIHEEFLRRFPEAVVIDQSPVGTSSRANPATYTGIMDDIRKAFAAANKVNAGLFSFNSKGACENCKGSGVIYTDLSFLNDAKTICEVCEGKRYKEEVLRYTWNGKSITDVLEMTMSEAYDFFDLKEVKRKLAALNDVGLDYLSLGQPLSTLSGGECQRIKLARELHKKGSIYVMDEPTTGLHMSNISHLLDIINRLVDSGNTVIAIEHNLDVIRNADWIIDIGPEGGNKGGTIMFTGTPNELRKEKHSLTVQYI